MTTIDDNCDVTRLAYLILDQRIKPFLWSKIDQRKLFFVTLMF